MNEGLRQNKLRDTSRRDPLGRLPIRKRPALSQQPSIASREASRVSSTVARSSAASRERKDVKMPAPEISFEADIKPLFREKDRDSMRRAFDLWSYADVQTHADAIAEHLKNGSMRATARGPRNGSGCSNAGSRRASRSKEPCAAGTLDAPRASH